MTYDEFLEKFEHRKPFLEWCTGGMSGGNCWGDEATEIYPEDEPDFASELWDFLNLIGDDNISTQEFDNIRYATGLVIRKEWTDSEYYGNYYYRSSKTIDLEVIWPFVQFMLDVPDASVRQSHYILMED